MDDDRDVFLPPKKFRYKTLHRPDAASEPAAADRARLPLKKSTVSAYRAAAAAAAADVAASAPSGSVPHPPQLLQSVCFAPSEAAPVKLPYCPYCQLPFGILISTAHVQHVAECAQMDRSHQTECPDTVHCQSSAPAHYARFSHLALARLRAYHSAATHALLTSPPLPAAQPQVHRDVQHLRQQAGCYTPRPSAAQATHISASNLQLLREARQQPAAPAPAAYSPRAAAGRVTHSPHGSLHSPLSVSLGSPHPSPASTSPQAPSPLPSSVAPPPAALALGRSSPSSELFPMRSRANTMSPPRGGRRYGCRPRSGSFNLPARPGSSASLTLAPRRAGFSIAEIMEPADGAGALDLSVRRRAAPFDDFQEDPQDSISECVSDAVERFLDEDSKQSGTAQDSGIDEVNRVTDSAASEANKPSDSGSAGSKLTVSADSGGSRPPTGAISQPPKKRRLALDSRQAVITGYFPTGGPAAPAPAPAAAPAPAVSAAQEAAETAGPPAAAGSAAADSPAPSAMEPAPGRSSAGPATSDADTKEQWSRIMSKMRPSSVTPAQQQRTQVNGDRTPAVERKCPFYKLIPGAPFAVDAFNYGIVPGVEAYFLSHFHYDHYRGLSKTFPKTVYCGKVTGNLVITRLKVPAERIKMLPMNEPKMVYNVEVTLLDANHCPGAVMFLFKFRDGRAFLHVGDFRADPSMESYPELWNTAIDRVYLDTTYCDPVYDFPSQSDILHQCVRIVNEAIQKNPKTLVVCGSYTIGKERVFLAVAEALDSRIWASADKRRTLQCLEERQIKRRLTTDQRLARIHVLPLGHLTMKTLQNYLKIFQSQYTHIVAIKPTGWEHGKDLEPHGEVKPKVSGNIAIYGVPYSEHSSYSELRRFIQFVQPREIIPTVNVGSAQSRALMDATFREWLRAAPLRQRQPSGPAVSG